MEDLPNDQQRITIAPPGTAADREWLTGLWHAEWGGDVMVSRGQTHRAQDAEALIAWQNGVRTGAATFHFSAKGAELLSINAMVKGGGVGSALLTAFEAAARAAGQHRAWLITSNDNLDALRFYQRRGYRIAAVYSGAIDEARRIKPAIPLVGDYGIPIHDEIELEKWL